VNVHILTGAFITDISMLLKESSDMEINAFFVALRIRAAFWRECKV